MEAVKEVKMFEVILACDFYEEDLPEFAKQEWDSQSTFLEIQEILRSNGYACTIVNGTFELIETLCDRIRKRQQLVVWNGIEGFGSRNREAYVPAICESLGVSYTGSDSYANAITLDKFLTKQIAKNCGLEIPNALKFSFAEWKASEAKVLKSLRKNFLDFQKPFFLKPNGEGSSIGIFDDSIVTNPSQIRKYFQTFQSKSEFDSQTEFLAEEYLPGNEFTLGFFSEKGKIYFLPLLKVTTKDRVYSFSVKSKSGRSEKLSVIKPQWDKTLQKKVSSLFRELGITGFGRMDLKEDERGVPKFLELNLTPGFSKEYSSLPYAWKKSGKTFDELVLKNVQLGIQEQKHKKFAYGNYRRENLH